MFLVEPGPQGQARVPLGRGPRELGEQGVAQGLAHLAERLAPGLLVLGHPVGSQLVHGLTVGTAQVTTHLVKTGLRRRPQVHPAGGQHQHLTQLVQDIRTGPPRRRVR